LIEPSSAASLVVREGQIVTVIGPNGVGKSTLLNAIAALQSSEGQIKFLGKPIEDLETEQRVERGICLVPEKRELFPSMTVLDNLVLRAFLPSRRAINVQNHKHFRSRSI
jgi:branched-chain amino acid transport system ATP-binding protein